MAGIKEVAEFAGVSTATVSRVLGNKPHVRPEVREKVLEAVRLLDGCIYAGYLQAPTQERLRIGVQFGKSDFDGLKFHCAVDLRRRRQCRIERAFASTAQGQGQEG